MAERKTVLIVEGPSDREVLRALVNHAGMGGQVQVAHLEGNTGTGSFEVRLRAELVKSGNLQIYGTFVIVRDCDDDGEHAFRDAAAVFRKLKLPEPTGVGQVRAGKWTTVDDEFAVRTAVWLLPGVGQQGTLESLLVQSVQGDPKLDCVDALLACWGERGVPQPAKPGNADRRKMQVWLSQFVDAHGYVLPKSSFDRNKVSPLPWDLDHPVFKPTLEFLRRLYAQPVALRPYRQP